MSLSLSVQFIGPAGLFRKAGPVLALPGEFLLGRDTGALGPFQEHNVVMVIGGKLPSGAGWQGPEDLEGTAPCCSQSNRLTCTRVLEARIISFPSPRVLTDVLLMHSFSQSLTYSQAN